MRDDSVGRALAMGIRYFLPLCIGAVLALAYCATVAAASTSPVSSSRATTSAQVQGAVSLEIAGITLPLPTPTLPIPLPTLPVTLPTLPVTIPPLPVTLPTLPVLTPTSTPTPRPTPTPTAPPHGGTSGTGPTASPTLITHASPTPDRAASGTGTSSTNGTPTGALGGAASSSAGTPGSSTSTRSVTSAGSTALHAPIVIAAQPELTPGLVLPAFTLPLSTGQLWVLLLVGDVVLCGLCALIWRRYFSHRRVVKLHDDLSIVAPK